METWALMLAKSSVKMNGKTYIKAVPEFEPFFSSAGGGWTKKTLPSLAEDPPDEEVHECRDQ